MVNVTGGLTVTVTGGASDVGSKEGYDNEGLATRRAQNFINAVQGKFKNVTFKTASKVGVATVKNSPEANKEQFVRLDFTQTSVKTTSQPAVDNTEVIIKKIVPIVRSVPKVYTDDMTNVCFTIPKSRLRYIEWFIKTLGGAVK